MPPPPPASSRTQKLGRGGMWRLIKQNKTKPLQQSQHTQTKVYVSFRSFKDQAFSFSINKEFFILGLENISESTLG